jgi:ketosteroid isomerase-like protein
VEVLSGTWERGFLALSRWPGAHAARAFWLGAPYQGEAIPERAGAGAFDVVALAGERDDVADAGGARALVHRFLQCLWHGDKAGAKACFAEGAEWWFRPSLGYPAPMPCSDAVDIVMDDMIGRFDVNEPFDVDLHHLLADGDEVLAEYTARGTTVSGKAYRHRYALRASVGEGGIRTVRPWVDTKYFLETLYGD